MQIPNYVLFLFIISPFKLINGDRRRRFLQEGFWELSIVTTFLYIPLSEENFVSGNYGLNKLINSVTIDFGH